MRAEGRRPTPRCVARAEFVSRKKRTRHASPRCSPLAACYCGPCLCSAPVHRSCLIRWQRQRQQNRNDPWMPSASLASEDVCEICRAPWSIPLTQLQRECWVRSAQTSTSYLGLPEGILEPSVELDLLSSMQVGALVVQSPIRAANNGRQVNAAARAMRGDTRALALFSSPDAAARRARVESTAAWAEHGARGLPRMLREKGVWHLGCFLIAHVGRGAAADGTDTLVALNLARRVVEDHEGMSLQVADDVASTPAALAAARAAAGGGGGHEFVGDGGEGGGGGTSGGASGGASGEGASDGPHPRGPRPISASPWRVTCSRHFERGSESRLPHEVFRCLTAGRAIPRSHSAYCG